MLDLDDKTLATLRASGALTIDQDGEWVLVGLTRAESEFFLLFEQDPGDGDASSGNNLYLELRHKHLLARNAAVLADLAPPELQHKDSPML